MVALLFTPTLKNHGAIVVASDNTDLTFVKIHETPSDHGNIPARAMR
jgi:hypothetical protein